jgi:HTH-type transcriptional regulator/antitoxin HigA
MTKRGWVRNTDKLDELEQEIIAYFGIKSLTDEIRFCHAPKKTQSDQAPSKLQLAWLFRARSVARAITPSELYSTEKLEETLNRLKGLRRRPEDVREIAALLSRCGIRFVVVEPIPRAKIDGACFWLTNDAPVVAMSLRLDRIDNFWFVLRHELEHVLRGHGKEDGYILETDLEGTSSNADEQVANEAAAEFCVPQQALSTFLTQLGTHISNERLLAFARELEVHPGLVAGQVQRRLERFDLFRKLQVKVRNLVIASAHTDGYGAVAVDPVPMSRHATSSSFHQFSNGSTR